jgi:chromosome segregation ATPase
VAGAPAPSFRKPRGTSFAVLALFVALVGGALAWGFSESSALSQRDQQLSAVQNELTAAQEDLSAATQRNLALQADVRRATLQWAEAKSKLTKLEHQVGVTSTAQLSLSASAAVPGLCEQGAALGQQAVQLLATATFVETSYLRAADELNRTQMQKYLGQVRGLDSEARQLGPKLAASAQQCAKANP